MASTTATATDSPSPPSLMKKFRSSASSLFSPTAAAASSSPGALMAVAAFSAAASLWLLSAVACDEGPAPAFTSLRRLLPAPAMATLGRRLCPLVSTVDPWAFFTISYRQQSGDADDVYLKGPKDVLFIAGWMLMLAVVQRVCGDLLAKLYRHVNDYWAIAEQTESEESVRKVQQMDSDLSKFKEQAYLFVYYTLSLAVGLRIYWTSKYYPMLEKSHEFWTDYPLAQLDALVKYYYLIQAAFWLQQLFSFLFFTAKHERRKDHWAMVGHHVITTGLVLSSYVFHLTRVGNAVLICMDTSDIFLCLAKSLKYLRFQKVCDVIFGLFVLSWIVLRHGLYFYIWWSVMIEGSQALKDTKWDPWLFRDLSIASEYERPGTYYSKGSWTFYFFSFAGLQCLLIMWFIMIIKVLVKVVRGTGAEDVRED